METAELALLPPLTAGWAFALAFASGAVATLVTFGTLGAVTDTMTFGDRRRMWMWVLAIAVTFAGSAMLVRIGRSRRWSGLRRRGPLLDMKTRPRRVGVRAPWDVNSA